MINKHDLESALKCQSGYLNLTDGYASRQFTAISMIALCFNALKMGTEWSVLDIQKFLMVLLDKMKKSLIKFYKSSMVALIFAHFFFNARIWNCKFKF